MSVSKVTTADFKSEVLGSSKPVLVDFFATWCGPCKMLSPIVDEIADENDSIKVVKVDVDDEPELANMFGVSSIPTLVVIKDGNAVAKSIGYRSKADVLKMISDGIGA
ncbi:MAG: thioredoxin [Clostridiales bacterium]|nr:thioredoxin [Clostridiales bacterium]